MANTKNKKVANQNTKSQEEKVMKNTNAAVEEKKEVVVKEKVTTKSNKEKKVRTIVTQMTNSELQKLFMDNGCQTYTKASDDSKVVYNTFGTKSRVLQQNRAYQLLLTSGHKMMKDEIVETDNNDTLRFIAWYDSLSDEDKKMVNGYAELTNTKLSPSEMPREHTVKLSSFDLLVKFLQFMGGFEENQILK